MTRRAAVGNAADTEQVARATETDRRRLLREKEDLLTVLSTPQGRRFLWRLLGQVRTFASVYDGNGLHMAYSAGRQDVGHFLISEIGEADPEMWLLMQVEANQLELAGTEAVPATEPTANQDEHNG